MSKFNEEATYSRTGMFSFHSWKQPKLKPTASRPVFFRKLMLVTLTSAVNRRIRAAE